MSHPPKSRLAQDRLSYSACKREAKIGVLVGIMIARNFGPFSWLQWLCLRGLSCSLCHEVFGCDMRTDLARGVDAILQGTSGEFLKGFTTTSTCSTVPSNCFRSYKR